MLNKEFEKFLQSLNKKHGEGSIFSLSANAEQKVPFIPTGSVTLDVALGIGGIPRGRVIELFGSESSGKTTLSLSIALECQKLGGTVAFIDAEHSLDVSYVKSIGINLDHFYLNQPDYGEQGLSIVESLVESNHINLIIVDSVASLVPKVELEGEMGDRHMGLQARLMSQALRKLTSIISKTQCSVIFINQTRENIGGYGASVVTTGGNALKFYSSVRMKIMKIEQLKKDSIVYGNKVKVEVVKNKVAPPYKKIEFDIIFGKGVDQLGSLLNLCISYDLLLKKGTWYYYKEISLGQGFLALKNYYLENEDKLKILKKELQLKLNFSSPLKYKS